MTERRYTDEEVATIFREAAEGQRTDAVQQSDGGGLTLAELQSIGREVGLSPTVVTRAALALDLTPRESEETFLSLPIGVERSVTLNRTVTDAEWEQLVGELRTTFRAKGKLAVNGGFREWTNGNLQALLEPTSTGHRLRLRTVKGNARSTMVMALISLGTAAVVWSASILAGNLGATIPGVAMLGLAGLGVFGFTAARLPAWARLRGKQMDAIASRVAQPAYLLNSGHATTE